MIWNYELDNGHHVKHDVELNINLCYCQELRETYLMGALCQVKLMNKENTFKIWVVHESK